MTLWVEQGPGGVIALRGVHKPPNGIRSPTVLFHGGVTTAFRRNVWPILPQLPGTI